MNIPILFQSVGKEHIRASVQPRSSIRTQHPPQLSGCSSHGPGPRAIDAVVKDMSLRINKICSLISTFQAQIIKICSPVPQVHEKLTNKFCILISLMSEKPLNKSVKLYSLARGQMLACAELPGPALIVMVFKRPTLRIQCQGELISIKMLSSLFPAGCNVMRCRAFRCK